MEAALKDSVALGERLICSAGTEAVCCVVLSCRSQEQLCLPGIDTARKVTTRYDQSETRCHSRP
jgi:hypothetical protein